MAKLKVYDDRVDYTIDIGDELEADAVIRLLADFFESFFATEDDDDDDDYEEYDSYTVYPYDREEDDEPCDCEFCRALDKKEVEAMKDGYYIVDDVEDYDPKDFDVELLVNEEMFSEEEIQEIATALRDKLNEIIGRD